MLFYFDESSYCFPKQIDKAFEEHTLSCQMYFVSSESIMSAKKVDSLQSQKLIFFQKKNTASVSPIPRNWDIEVTMQIKLYIRAVVFFTIF
jgi:hypothetical protein